MSEHKRFLINILQIFNDESKRKTMNIVHILRFQIYFPDLIVLITYLVLVECAKKCMFSI